MHRGHETAEVRDVRRTAGGRGLRRGVGKVVDVVSPGWPQSFRFQRRPVDDCSLGRGGMVQDGRTRGGMFHGEMDRCRETLGWTTTCSSTLERDGKGQGGNNLKQACSCWFVRHHSYLATSGTNLYLPSVFVLFVDSILPFSGVVVSCPSFCFHPRPFVQSLFLGRIAESKRVRAGSLVIIFVD